MGRGWRGGHVVELRWLGWGKKVGEEGVRGDGGANPSLHPRPIRAFRGLDEMILHDAACRRLSRVLRA